jgi:ABC-2 type transport system ATP-binding protein
VAAGLVKDVLAVQDLGEHRVRVAEPARAAELIVEAGATARLDGDHIVVSGVSDPAWITETLGGHGLWVQELTPVAPDLEDVFLTLTGTMPEPGLHRQVDDSVQPALAAAGTEERS